MLLQNHVGHRQHQRMTGVHEHRAAQTWPVEWLNGRSLETYPLIPLQHRLLLTPIAPRDPAVPFPYRGWNVGDLKTPDLTGMGCTAKRIYGFG
jgi:hypothetical protein